MKPNWTIQQEILKRVNKEADYEWAINSIPPAFPEFYPEKPRKSLGLANFFRSSVVLLKEITP